MRFELAVAAFDDRAVSVYEALDFRYVETHPQATNGGVHEFLRMGREAWAPSPGVGKPCHVPRHRW